ncbi:unnamed protein product [Effrenium voratum]|uniref:Uncharacterized protein n=1 Tax=Effrenium voratum TaxID=2562239 RepID=A0AA36HTE4_9DINO|nr:unnamed protein product [Effrenium voratum]CAJ1374937.1 unnamed protein product [Effrenium voratum]CAJ1461993.1 unnamed protein product [Effrenium voratum]
MARARRVSVSKARSHWTPPAWLCPELCGELQLEAGKRCMLICGGAMFAFSRALFPPEEDEGAAIEIRKNATFPQTSKTETTSMSYYNAKDGLCSGLREKY